MKSKIITAVLLFTAFMVNAQVYNGKGDTKLQIGASVQNGGTGINVTTDFGIGENMSFGFSAVYLLSADEVLNVKPDFMDRADIKARFNANIGNIINIDEKLDVYPGLNLGLRNLGTHLGVRYFFSDGFGVYTEGVLPIAKYDSTPELYGNYNNQFTFNIGASFNL